jgi:hypothetical protein
LTFETQNGNEKREYVSKYGKVRQRKVRNALKWLCANNALYNNVVIDHEAIDSLPEDGIPETFLEKNVVVALDEDTDQGENVREERVTYVESNSGMHVSFDQMSRMSLSDLILKVKGYNKPKSEWDQDFLPGAFPTLFPCGQSFRHPVTLLEFTRHCLLLGDSRFRSHHSFIFAVYNMMKRRESVRQVGFQCKSANFVKVEKAVKNLLANSSEGLLKELLSKMSSINEIREKHPEISSDIGVILNSVKRISAKSNYTAIIIHHIPSSLVTHAMNLCTCQESDSHAMFTISPKSS